MEASGLFVLLRLGEKRIKSPDWELEVVEGGILLKSPWIRYTKFLEVRIEAFISDERLYERLLFTVDPRKGDAYLLNLLEGKTYKFGITRKKPDKLKNVLVRMETRTG